MCSLSAVATARVALGRALQPGAVGLDAVDALLGERRDGVDSSGIDCSRLRAISGMRTLSSNWPCMPPIVIAVSLPMTCAADLQDDLGEDRVDLARHDRRALLQLGQEDLADAGARAGAHQREVAGDLGQRDGDDLQRAGQLDERVAVGLRLERVLGRRRSAQLRCRASRRARTRSANFGWVLRPVPVAVPPSGIWPTCRSAASTRSLAEPDLRRVAGELLAERDGHGVHEVRAAGLDDVRRTPRPCARSERSSCSSAGSSVVRRLVERGEVHGAREHVVGGLPHVHVVVGVRALAGERRDAPRWRSCSTTCPSRSGRRRSGTGRRARPRRPRRRRRRSRSASSASSRPSSALTRAAAPLMRPSQRTTASGTRLAGDREVVDGLRRSRRRRAVFGHALAPYGGSAAEGRELARDADRVVVGHQEAGARQHAQLRVGQQVERLLGDRAAGAGGPRRPTAAASGRRSAG